MSISVDFAGNPSFKKYTHQCECALVRQNFGAIFLVIWYLSEDREHDLLISRHQCSKGGSSGHSGAILRPHLDLPW